MKQTFITNIYSSITENNNFTLKIPLSQNFIEKAKNGTGVLDELRLKSIDIVVRDITMPEINLSCMKIYKAVPEPI